MPERGTFAARDWNAVRRAKDDDWAERIARLGPIEGFRTAEELRRQALLQNAVWPEPEQRREDLAAHVRLAGVFSCRYSQLTPTRIVRMTSSIPLRFEAVQPCTHSL